MNAVNVWYLLAALVSGWLTFDFVSLVFPVWFAVLVGFQLACPVAFIGVIRDELPRLKSAR